MVDNLASVSSVYSAGPARLKFQSTVSLASSVHSHPPSWHLSRLKAVHALQSKPSKAPFTLTEQRGAAKYDASP